MTARSMKLLVATEFPPNAPGGGPAVVRQMLRDWPTENLAWWSCGPDPDLKHGRKVREHAFWRIPARFRPHRRFARLKSSLIEMFWAPAAAAHLARTIGEQKPDVIWAIPHDWSIIPLRKVLVGGRIPYHVSMHDYVDVHENPRKLGIRRCGRMAQAADLLYRQASTRDAISRPMIADLEARAGATAAQIARAGLEPSEMEWLRSDQPAAQPEIRIAYAGTILAEPEFELFVKALQELRQGHGIQVRIELFGSHSYSRRQWFDASWMSEHGELPHGVLLTRLRECTWGFSPMRLDDADARYNRFSLPTKFVSYLAAGLPIIALAHEQSSLAEMMSNYRVGPLLTSRDSEALGGRLLEVLRDRNPGAAYRSELVRCAETEFDAERMRRILRNCFDVCARGTSQQDFPKICR